MTAVVDVHGRLKASSALCGVATSCTTRRTTRDRSGKPQWLTWTAQRERRQCVARFSTQQLFDPRRSLAASPVKWPLSQLGWSQSGPVACPTFHHMVFGICTVTY